MKLGSSVEPKWLPHSLILIVRCLSIALKRGAGERRTVSNLKYHCWLSFRPINLQNSRRESVCVFYYELGRVLEEVPANWSTKKKLGGEGVPLQKPWKPN